MKRLITKEVNFPSLSGHYLLMPHCLRVGPHRNFPFCHSFSVEIVIVQVLFRQSYCWGAMGVASMSFLRDTTSQQVSWSSGSYNLSFSSSAMFPEPLVQELSCRCICSWGPHYPLISAIWPVVVFCNGFPLSVKRSFLSTGQRWVRIQLGIMLSSRLSFVTNGITNPC